MFRRSPRGTSPVRGGSVDLAEGTLSPVRAASSICREAQASSRPSAGTASPASSSTTSPGTRRLLSSSATAPSRRTLLVAAVMVCRASIAASLALLDNAQDGVQQHHRQDDEHLGEGLMGQVVGDGGYGGGGHQDQQHGVPQLLQKPLEQRWPLGASRRRLGPYCRRRVSASRPERPVSAACRSSRTCRGVGCTPCAYALLLIVGSYPPEAKTHAQAKPMHESHSFKAVRAQKRRFDETA